MLICRGQIKAYLWSCERQRRQHEECNRLDHQAQKNFALKNHLPSQTHEGEMIHQDVQDKVAAPRPVYLPVPAWKRDHCALYQSHGTTIDNESLHL